MSGMGLPGMRTLYILMAACVFFVTKVLESKLESFRPARFLVFDRPSRKLMVLSRFYLNFSMRLVFTVYKDSRQL